MKALPVVVLLLAAGLLAAAAQLTWVTGTLEDPVLGRQTAAATGTRAAPVLLVLALAAAAAALAAAVTGGWLRRACGALGAVLAAGAAWSIASVLRDPAAALAAGSPDPAVGGRVPVQDVDPTAWPWAALVLGVLAVGAALAVALRGGGSGLSRRYETPGGRQEATGPGRGRPERAVSDWDRLTRGDDPTL